MSLAQNSCKKKEAIDIISKFSTTQIRPTHGETTLLKQPVLQARHCSPSPGRYPTHQPTRLSRSTEETLATHSEPLVLE